MSNSTSSVRRRPWRLMRAIVVALALLAGTSALATTVRGRVHFPNGAYASGVEVRIVGSSRAILGSAYSGQDGMYYLYDIPPGKYTLEILLRNKNVLRFSITVSNDMFSDVAPVALP